MAKSRVSTPQAGAAFVKDVTQPDPGPEFDPTRPRSFDLGGFLAGAYDQRPSRTIPVTYRPDIAAEVEALTTERDTLTAALAEDESSPRRRLAEKSGRAERATQIATLLADLEPQLDGTWAMVKLRPITPSEQDTLRARSLTPGVELFAGLLSLTAKISTPGSDEWSTLDPAEWATLLDALGPSQFRTLDQAHEALSYRAVTPDFSEQHLRSRTTTST